MAVNSAGKTPKPKIPLSKKIRTFFKILKFLRKSVIGMPSIPGALLGFRLKSKYRRSASSIGFKNADLQIKSLSRF